ncbi:MAG: hypothetical protein V4692_08850, partial [Bdellovibrionota bacterium]
LSFITFLLMAFAITFFPKRIKLNLLSWTLALACVVWLQGRSEENLTGRVRPDFAWQFEQIERNGIEPDLTVFSGSEAGYYYNSRRAFTLFDYSYFKSIPLGHFLDRCEIDLVILYSHFFLYASKFGIEPQFREFVSSPEKFGFEAKARRNDDVIFTRKIRSHPKADFEALLLPCTWKFTKLGDLENL